MATTPISRIPQAPCSIFIHTGKVPGIAMIAAMATTMIAETSRSRRYIRLAPRAARLANRVISRALATTMVPRIHTADVTSAWWLRMSTMATRVATLMAT